MINKKTDLVMILTATYLAASAQVDRQLELAMWANTVASPSGYTEKLYADQAVVIYPEHEGLREVSVDDISEFYKAKRWKNVKTPFSLGITSASPWVDYEVVGFQADEQEYVQLIIWNQKSGKQLRELEVLAKADPNAPEAATLDTARAEWIRLCNLHEPKKLVEEMYTPDAMYYNHKPMVTGTDAITKEYWYMSNSSYELSLTPLIVQVVSGDLAFEIGQCSGSYNGKYVLVWTKSQENGWQVALDSNI
ncbi:MULTISPECIES: DUF4440 domain-containing protein [unclassified Imperialibacter]|uniref:YybH family protein n=1 Tax=unclassified Imperialibacter TaxID=2629706 RepID=UPI0012556158|nr:MULTISPECIES: DUF4440 domain-containing protein [unclassified Imperialibacter]CAD5250480.1 conserved hypothetical protein [Imperialibacter sp. 75]CAD5286808.1 conserved hypothetical protein [Imperialibacter sp. 89]VVT05815.1 conserved hypothetical protein [Imperialibacter sp. EC-SDR9]